jgi:hemerythrin
MIIYTSDCKTHIRRIDEQHQELIDLLNLLESLEKDAHSGNEIESTLDFLGEYVKTHFSYEEELMLENGYPHYEWHKNWHQGYISKYTSLKDEYALNGASEEFSTILHDFIIKWIASHIKNVDTTLGKFLNNKKAS